MVAKHEDADTDDAYDEEADVRERDEVVDDLGHRRPGGFEALDRGEMHLATELRSADMGEEAVPGEEPAVHLGRPERRTQDQVEVRRQAQDERDERLEEDDRFPRDLAPSVDQDERDDDRDDRDGEPVVRDAQATEERTDEQIPVAAFARQTSARWRSSATSSRWRPFISEKVASCQSVPVTARHRAAPVAMTGRTPRRTAMKTTIPTAAAAATADNRVAR